MAVTKWCVWGLCLCVLIGAPWLLAPWFFVTDRVVWECHSDFEILKISSDQTAVRTVGAYSQFFHGNNSGFSRISGRNEHFLQRGKLQVRNFHRFIDFEYVHNGPYLRKTVTKTVRKPGDTTSAEQDPAGLSPVGEDVYLQVLKLGPNAYAFGRLGMPRQLCQGRQGWLAPRLR